MNEIEANISIFFASFFSATILPGHSELALTALISLKKQTNCYGYKKRTFIIRN